MALSGVRVGYEKLCRVGLVGGVMFIPPVADGATSTFRDESRIAFLDGTGGLSLFRTMGEMGFECE